MMPLGGSTLPIQSVDSTPKTPRGSPAGNGGLPGQRSLRVWQEKGADHRDFGLAGGLGAIGRAAVYGRSGTAKSYQGEQGAPQTGGARRGIELDQELLFT